VAERLGGGVEVGETLDVPAELDVERVGLRGLGGHDCLDGRCSGSGRVRWTCAVWAEVEQGQGVDWSTRRRTWRMVRYLCVAL
jgi:hypothetical protein